LIDGRFFAMLEAGPQGPAFSFPIRKTKPGRHVIRSLRRVVRPLSFAAGAVALIGLLSGAGIGQTIEEKAQICSACHGEKGVPVDPKIPVIWGQYEGYLYIELRDFKTGNRKNEQMNPIAESLEKADMKALAHYFSQKPWPILSQRQASDADTLHAEQVASSAQCPQCHLGGYLGASTVPRLAGQGHDYLLKTMQDFRSGARANNDWMTALLQKFSPDDLAALANYLAGL
jgi:cytochrome c553